MHFVFGTPTRHPLLSALHGQGWSAQPTRFLSLSTTSKR